MWKPLPLLAALLSLALLAPAAPAAAKEAPAYIAIGDSLAYGVGASDPAVSGYVALTYGGLHKSDRYSDRGLELLNLGVPGATSSDLLLPGGQLERAVTEIRERREDTSSSDDNVEIITVDIGGNDVLGLATPDSPCLADPLASDCQAIYGVMLKELEANLTEVLEVLREAAPSATIVVMDLYSPLSGRGGGGDLIADYAVGGINDATGRVVSDEELDVRMASVWPIFAGRAEGLVAADGIHPNDEGHALMSEVVLSAIEGRAPELPEEYQTPSAVREFSGGPMGEGGLTPLSQDADDDGGLPMALAVAIPMAVLGAAAVAGVYVAGRGRERPGRRGR
jgi:lysophospholipase L1-like esterase